jgi:hypothetical protein
LRGGAMAGQDRGHAAWIGSPETALCGDAEVVDNALGSSDPRSISCFVIELQQA